MKKQIFTLMVSTVALTASPAFAMEIVETKTNSQHPITAETLHRLISQAKEGNLQAQDELMRRHYLGSIPKLKTKDINFLSWTNIHKRCDDDVYAYFAIIENIDIPSLVDKIKERADQGIPAAQTNLAAVYQNGYKIGGKSEENDKLAVCWLTKAAEKDYFPAQHNLARAYKSGYRFGGISEENHKLAVCWFTKAAKQGCPRAQHNLAYMYKEGRGVGGKSYKNNRKAFKLFKKSAKQGFPIAQVNLGWMYANGSGIEENPIESLRWAMKSKRPEASGLIQQFFHGSFARGEKKYSFDGKKDYAGSFKNMLDDILGGGERLDENLLKDKLANFQQGNYKAIKDPLMGLESLAYTHQIQKQNNNPERCTPHNELAKLLCPYYEKVEAVEGELLELITSLKANTTPGFMITGLGYCSDKLEESFKYQGIPPFLSLHRLDRPNMLFTITIPVPHFSIGEQNVSLAVKLAACLETIDQKCEEVDTALKEIARIYQERSEIVLTGAKEFEDNDEVLEAHKFSQSQQKSQVMREAMVATEKERRSLENIKKRIKALPNYGLNTRNWEFFEENPWL